MIIVIDNTGTQPKKMFLPQIFSYLKERKLPYQVIKGDAAGLDQLQGIDHEDIEHIILSGSPLMLNGQTDKNEYICNVYCLEKLQHVPILGICFGCQLINVHFGGTLYDGGSVFCKSVEAFSAFRTHKVKLCARYLPYKVPVVFDVMMHLRRGNYEYPCLFKHKHLPMVGVMFHPEALKATQWVMDYFLNTTNKS